MDDIEWPQSPTQGRDYADNLDGAMLADESDLGFGSDMALNPRNLPFYNAGVKSEKDTVPPSLFALTSRMFDSPEAGALEYAAFYTDADTGPESSRMTPPLPRHRTPPVNRTEKPDDGGLGAASVALAEAAPQSPKRNKSAAKKPKTRPPPEPSPADAAGLDAKRSRCLERNRVAASKCREKKKAWVHELEAAKDELEDRHASLQREHNSLVDEAAQIKTSLMAHAGCNDRNIHMWIEGEAERFVRRSGCRHQHPARPESRHSSIVSLASQNSQNGTLRVALLEPSSLTALPRPWGKPESVAQSSTTAPTVDTQLSLPRLKTDSINFDHMPADMFTLDD